MILRCLVVTLALLCALPGQAAEKGLRVAVLNHSPPMSYTDEAGVLTGFNVEIMYALCEAMGVKCEPVPRRELPGRIEREARERGHEIDADACELLAEIAGPELGHVIDSLERLSLYVGSGARITEDAISQCVTRVRVSTVWELVEALSKRDTGTALAVLEDVYDPHDRGLRLLGLIAWAVRQLVRFAAARREGMSADAAASRAGVPPFKARQMAAQVAQVPPGEFERWLGVLADADLSLKGSKRHPRAVLEAAILTMMTGAPR